MHPYKRLGFGLALVTLLALPVASFAGNGAAITYAPPTSTNTVPTLSQWGLLALVSLMAVIGYRVLREKAGGRPIAAIVLAAALGWLAIFGEINLKDAMASVTNYVSNLSNPAGGQVSTLFGCDGSNSYTATVTNTSGVPQQILSITLEGSTIGAGSTCSQGTILSNGASCSFLPPSCSPF